MTEVGDILVKAIDQFDAHGWTTGTNVDERGRMCAVGAICKVMVGRACVSVGALDAPLYYKVVRALSRHVPSCPPFPSRPDLLDVELTVVRYNNSRMSYQEVRDWFEKAAMDEGVTL